MSQLRAFVVFGGRLGETGRGYSQAMEVAVIQDGCHHVKLDLGDIIQQRCLEWRDSAPTPEDLEAFLG